MSSWRVSRPRPFDGGSASLAEAGSRGSDPRRLRLPRGLTAIAGGALVLLAVAAFNGYPLVYSDSGTYISSGHSGRTPIDRPITYGLFLYWSSLATSLWFTAAAQNLLLSTVLWELVALFVESLRKAMVVFFSCVILLSLGTGAGWYSNQIMPDVFAPIQVLLLFVLLFGRPASAPKRIALSTLLVVSIAMHLTHLLIASLVLAIWGVFAGLGRGQQLKRNVAVCCTVAASWLVIPVLNATLDGKAYLSKASHMFLMAHMADTGTLHRFLAERCTGPPFHEYALCRDEEQVPQQLRDFLWDYNRAGNPANVESTRFEYNEILKEIVSTPRLLFRSIGASVRYGLLQLVRFDVGDALGSYREGSAPFRQVAARYPQEVESYLGSKQSADRLPFVLVSRIQRVVVAMSLIVICSVLALAPRRLSLARSFLLFSLLAMTVNAFATAGLNSPTDRFQARIVWILPLGAVLTIASRGSREASSRPSPPEMR